MSPGVGGGQEYLSIRRIKAQKNQAKALNKMSGAEWGPVAEAEGKVMGENEGEWESG